MQKSLVTNDYCCDTSSDFWPRAQEELLVINNIFVIFFYDYLF